MDDLQLADEMFGAILEELGAKTFLDDLHQALSVDERLENYRYIARMRDIDLQGIEDEEGEDA